MQHFGITWDDITVDGVRQLAWNSGTETPLIVARKESRDVKLNTKLLEHLAEVIRRDKIDLLVLDPLVELHTVEEIDNGHMKQVGRALAQLAQKGNCAVILIAHVRKPDKADATPHYGRLDAVRGAGSLGTTVRSAETMFTPGEKDKSWTLPYPRKDYVRMDDAKKNQTKGRDTPLWFKHVSVKIGNGEWVGVLQPVELRFDRLKETGDGATAIARVLREKLPDGAPHTFADMEEFFDPTTERPLFGAKSHIGEKLAEMFKADPKTLFADGALTFTPARQGVAAKFQFRNFTSSPTSTE